MVSSIMLVYGKRGGRRQRRCAWGKEFRIGEPALLVLPKNASLTAPHEPQGLGGRIYRLPPLPPTSSISVVFLMYVVVCYSMLPCDCDCRGCCGCRMFCWRVECCCCCCRAVVVAVVVIVLVFFSMLLLLLFL